MKKITDAYYKARYFLFSIEKDKLIHFILGIVAGAVALALAPDREVAAAAALFVLLAIEVWQMKTGAGKFEILDLVAGGMGILFLNIVLLFI